MISCEINHNKLEGVASYTVDDKCSLINVNRPECQLIIGNNNHLEVHKKSIYSCHRRTYLWTMWTKQLTLISDIPIMTQCVKCGWWICMFPTSVNGDHSEETACFVNTQWFVYCGRVKWSTTSHKRHTKYIFHGSKKKIESLNLGPTLERNLWNECDISYRFYGRWSRIGLSATSPNAGSRPFNKGGSKRGVRFTNSAPTYVKTWLSS